LKGVSHAEAGKFHYYAGPNHTSGVSTRALENMLGTRVSSRFKANTT